MYITNVTGILRNHFIEHEVNIERFVKNSVQYINKCNVKYSPKLWMYYTCLECAERKKCKLFYMSDRLALLLSKKKLQLHEKFPTCTWSDRGLYVAWLVVISIGRDIVPNVSTSRNVVSFGALSWLTVMTLIYTNIQPTKKINLVVNVECKLKLTFNVTQSPLLVALWGSQV